MLDNTRFKSYRHLEAVIHSSSQELLGQFARQKPTHLAARLRMDKSMPQRTLNAFGSEINKFGHSSSSSEFFRELSMSQLTDQSNAVISTERLLPVSPRRVFAAFEQPDRVAQWWGPDGFIQEFESDEVAARLRRLVEPANEQNLDRLQSLLASESA
jgi:hypothetical protein